jgi:hypothetical protein
MLFRLVIALTLCLASGTVSDADVSPTTIANVQRSVFAVVCFTRADSKIASVVGTGFFLSRSGQFVTAAHVLADLRVVAQRIGCVGGVMLPTGGAWSDLHGVIAAEWFALGNCADDASPAVDLATCDLVTNPFTHAATRGYVTPVLLEISRQPDGTGIAFSGFPLQNLHPITSKGYVAGYNFNERDEMVQIILDRTAWPGASGSPVYVDSGRVVGILTLRGTGDAAGLAYAQSAELIARFLSGHALPVTK